MLASSDSGIPDGPLFTDVISMLVHLVGVYSNPNYGYDRL